MKLRTLWNNTTTSPLTTLGGLLVATGGALLGAESAGVVAHMPEPCKLLGFVLTAVGPVLLGSQARQGNVTSEDAQATESSKAAQQ